MIPMPDVVRRRLLAAAGLGLALVVLLASPAWAHVELTSSSPADGSVLDSAPEAIRLEFSTPAEIAGEGIILYDEAGVVLASAVTLESDTTVLLRPTSPLGPGQHLVSWTMRAGDAHPKTGTIGFSVGATAAASNEPTVATGEGTTSTSIPAVFESLAAGPSTAVADWVGRFARLVGFGAVLLGLGAFIFSVLVFEGSRREAQMVGYWGRRAGAAILVAVPFEIASQAMLLGGGSLFAALNPSYVAQSLQGLFGLAVLLRAVGGAGLLAGTRLETSPARTGPESHGDSHVAGGGGSLAVKSKSIERFHLAASPIALAGAAAVSLSFLFDGHTAVTAPSWLVRFASVVHVTAASTWVGGVAMLAALFGRRRRLGFDLDAARLVVPFSTVAGAAVALVGLAGGVLALTTVDSLSAFFVTAWGRALLAKLALVGIAGAMGAYNHFVLVPQLKLPNGDPRAGAVVSRSVQVEIGILLGAVAITAVLVGLAS